jgi:prefoldin subunit 5
MDEVGFLKWKTHGMQFVIEELQHVIKELQHIIEELQHDIEKWQHVTNALCIDIATLTQHNRALYQYIVELRKSIHKVKVYSTIDSHYANHIERLVPLCLR